MGFLTCIARHDFYDLDDKAATRAFMQDTVLRLSRVFHIDPKHIKYEIYDKHDDLFFNYYNIEMPLYDVDLHLRRGVWEIWTYDCWGEFVEETDGRFPCRERLFDIVRALGCNDIWYWNDEYTPYHFTGTFDGWLEYVTPIFGEPKELNIEEFAGKKCNADDLWWCYHDSFGDYHERYAELASRIAPDRLIGLNEMLKDRVLVERLDGVNLMHKETLEMLFPESVEEIWDWETESVRVWHDGKCAIFDKDGNRISEFSDNPIEFS